MCRAYRLERKLGAGGMGEVYLAHDTRLNRQVAIKFLTAPADEQSRHRLLREARAAAGLEHPDICAIYEVGTDPASGDFIAMQYVEGETLAARLRRGRLRPEEALGIGTHIAEALNVAHRRGLVHRDLKPQNIIIAPSGAPKLLDFGLATPVVGSKASIEAQTVSQTGQADTVVGTPGYMAPEQIRNEPADVRTDVFALGCVIYECLTGRRAFQGATSADLMGQALVVDPPPVSSVVPDLGPQYDALCERLLHKIPGERFQSAEEVLGAIRALTPSARFSGPAPAPAAPASRWSGRRRAIVSMGVVAIGALAVWQWPRPQPLPVPTTEASGWYDRGVEAMRDGTYAAAREAFTQAVGQFPQYAQAYSRLAEANTALEDERGASAALVQRARLVPNQTRLPVEDQLRFEAASAANAGDYEASLAAYRRLAERKPKDAGLWLDVGRAEEAAGRTAAARASYERAVSLDGQYAAAHLRLGAVRTLVGEPAAALLSIDQAIGLYRKIGKPEGEAEALLRKGLALRRLGKTDAARVPLEQVAALALDDRYPWQRVRAQFELARLAYVAGQPDAAEDLSRRAVADATRARLPTLVASGFIDLGVALMGRREYDAADAQFVKAIELATNIGARRIAMRATLQQASLKLTIDRPDEALALAAEPLKFFSETNEVVLTAQTKQILARAQENLEHFDEASRLNAEALEFFETISKDDAQAAVVLENLAGELTKQGRLPEALAHRERIDDIHRQQKNQAALPKDLTNHAELLILLGRGRDAERLLQEVDDGIAAGLPTFVDRRVRVAELRALLAGIEQRWLDVLQATAAVEAASPKPLPGKTVKPSGLQLFARVLTEQALTRLGRSRTPADAIAKWPLAATTPGDRREWSYWVAATLVARGEHATAYTVASEVLAEPAVGANPELAWRLAAVAVQAGRNRPSVDGARMTEIARTEAGRDRRRLGGSRQRLLRSPRSRAAEKGRSLTPRGNQSCHND